MTVKNILTDAPLLPALPQGSPVMRVVLVALPSWNELLYLTPRRRASIVKDERQRGRAIAARWLTDRKIPSSIVVAGKGTVLRAKEPVFDKPLFCFVEVERRVSKGNAAKSDRTRDVYNVAVKAFIDGLTDANFWVDDSEKYHTDFWVHYARLAEESTLDIRFYYA